MLTSFGNSQPAPVSRQVSELVSKHDYPAAEKLLIDAIQADPRSASLLRTLGGVFFLDGKYLNCASALEKAKAANLLDESSRMTLAMAYVNLDRPEWA
ncbi:MAG: tetratricopeptide repeat protein, partial [Bryobacteraceae bacterium]